MRFILLIPLVLLFSGCAFVNSEVAFKYQPDAPSPLGELPKMAIEIKVEDVRLASEKDRIGNVRNGFNSITAAVVSTEPIEEVLYNTVAAELRHNGHSVVTPPQPADALVLVRLKSISSEAKANFWDVEITADFSTDVGAGKSLEEASASTFTIDGNSKKSSQIDTESSRNSVFNEALRVWIRSLSLDDRLYQALQDAAGK